MPLARSGWLSARSSGSVRAAVDSGRAAPKKGGPSAFEKSRKAEFKFRNNVARRGVQVTTLYSIGHSNRSLGDFLALLQANGIRALADIRQFTRSRANPQFNAETFATALAENGI